MNSIHSVRAMTAKPARHATAAITLAIALGAAVTQPVLAQSQAGGDQHSSAIQAGPVALTLGGFTELATIYRNRNQVADVGSDFNTGIPFNFNAQSQQSELRFSARQSRISLLAQGDPYAGAKAEAYFEVDFLSAGVTSNSRESNSYTLRMRHAYGRFQTDWGLDVLAGQNWSLATMYKKGLSPRDENIPLTIDAQYVVGFNWTRNPQLRIVQHINDMFSVGLSLESPQAVTSGGNTVVGTGGAYPGTTAPSATAAASCGTTTTYFLCGNSTGLLNSVTTYSTDTAPDVILKVAADPGYGHYELYGLLRFFTSNVARSATTTTGGGIGFGILLPLVPDVLSFRLSGLFGDGIGRYGSAQLPDVAERPDGSLAAIRAAQFLTGLTLTPNSQHTFYLYYGREQAESRSFIVGDAGFGYGSPLANNTGCELATGGSATCQGNTQKVYDITLGWWWKFYQGVLGNAQFGLQGAYLQREVFGGIGGSPSANIFIGMASFRYYPYQN